MRFENPPVRIREASVRAVRTGCTSEGRQDGTKCLLIAPCGSTSLNY